MTADLEAEQTSGRGREGLPSAIGLVTERRREVLRPPHGITLAAIAALDVGHGVFDRFIWHIEPCVLCRAQGQQLPHGHTDVGIAALRLVAPATLVAVALGHTLRFDDQLHRAFEPLANLAIHLLVLRHAKHLRIHERHDAVAIHARAVAATEVALRLLVVLVRLDELDHELERLRHCLTFRRGIRGHVPHTAQTHDRERRHRACITLDIAFLRPLIVLRIQEIPIRLLLLHQPLHRPVNGQLHHGRDRLWRLGSPAAYQGHEAQSQRQAKEAPCGGNSCNK